ncbi:ecto-NOX disulfide-thiol exchanger 2 [Contarinia nasturtii]|uniref:ecto-NOX disulfide-thiol exchanger 2 n=1 Tax=Contarinia nasturtii TaxID=265458 RepID=UPI0012D459C9|nr:ecto-NOX disulfide-thiol exchanger 2 [Contarinia nasturtii]
MSYNYPTIANNALPAMLPLLTNLANGNHFLPTLAAANQAVTAGLFSAHNAAAAATTALAENALEFNRTTTKLCQIGSGPMDLETLNDERDTQSFIQSPSGSELSLASTQSVRKIDENCEKNYSTFNPCDIMYNMGIPSQNLMMMPGVMNMVRDASSIVQTLPQFSLLNQLQSVQTSTVSTANLSDTNTTSAISTTLSSTNSSGIVKETITCKSCVLLPPNPNAPPPSTRERPSGCRTVFVGGLPENISEEIIKDVFERCGEITTLRLSKKNFCHIRFVFEASVDSAIYLSGYRIRINNLTDSPNCGRLHVDFAQARDDQYEFECKQRQWQREQRHRERLERDRSKLSPPIVYFSEHEAAAIAEKLKQDDTFSKAVQIFITWLERGDCNKKNSNTFYSMIQSTNAHIRRLLSEKSVYEDELNKAKEIHRKQMQNLSTQQLTLERVFGAASHKKVWDHFTKAQRKNIDVWKKQSLEIQVPLESLESHDTDEMDMSDEDDAASLRYGKRPKNSSKENESKKSDTMAYAHSSKALDVREQQLKVLHETIRNLQTQLLENKTKEKENLTKISELEDKLKQANVKELLLKTRIVEASKGPVTSISTDHASKSSVSDKDVVYVDDGDCDVPEKPSKLIDSKYTIGVKPSESVENENINDDDNHQMIDVDAARLIGLISSFLVVHPFGASLENIITYVQQVSMPIHDKDVENILRRYKSVFIEMDSQPNADEPPIAVERKWKFCGFDLTNSSTIVIHD